MIPKSRLIGLQLLYHMIAIAILRPTFTRSFYTESDAFLNLKKKIPRQILTCIHNTIKSTYTSI